MEIEKKGMAIVALADSGTPNPALPSVKGQCSYCLGGVWLAPSSLAQIEKEPNVTIFCSDCVDVTKIPVASLKLMPGQIEEIRKMADAPTEAPSFNN
jgi:hypothetical protein